MYDIRRVKTDDASIRECAALLSRVFPRSNYFSDGYLKWEYAENPEGSIVGFNAYSGETLAAHYVTQPAIARVFGKECRGLLSLNTATHEDHRGKRLFTMLATRTYEYAAENGYDFVFGVANANSTPGFIKHLGFQLVSPLHVRVGLGKISRRAPLRRWEFERTWSRRALDWRMRNPLRAYEIVDGRIQVATGKFGIKGIMGEFESELLQGLRCESISSLNPLRLFVGLDSSIRWRLSPYFTVPERLKSSPLNFIFKDLTGRSRHLAPERVKFRILDFDGY